MGEGPDVPTRPVPIIAEIIPGLIWGFRLNALGIGEPLTDRSSLETVGEGWLWLHFNLADRRTKIWLANSVKMPRLGLDMLVSPDDTQRLAAGDDCVRGIIFDLVHGFDRNNDEFGHLRFVMTDNVLITGRRRPLNSVETIRQDIERGRRFPTATDLVKAIIDELANGIDKIVEQLVTETDHIEDSILGNLAFDERQRLGRVRSTTVRIHRRLNGLRALLRRFAGDVSGELGIALRGSIAHLLQRLDEIDHDVVEVRDRARLLQEEISVKLAEETNRHLHVLSILTALLLPPALIAGLFGMNVEGLPFTANGHGFWWALLLTLASSGAALLVLRAMGVFRR